jgi:hypothetical protein
MIGDEETAKGPEGMFRFPLGTLLSHQTSVVAVQATGYQTLYGKLPDFEVSHTNSSVPDMTQAVDWSGTGTISLSNTGDEVLLFDACGTIIDVATWGTGIYPGVTAHATVAIGSSLERLVPQDGDDCTVDFVEQTVPTPGQPWGNVPVRFLPAPDRQKPPLVSRPNLTMPAASLTICALSGRVVRKFPAGTNSAVLNVSPGVYFCHLKSGGQTYAKRTAVR